MPPPSLASRSQSLSLFNAEADAFARAFSENVECGGAFVEREIQRLTDLAERMVRDVEAWRAALSELHACQRSLDLEPALEAILAWVIDDHLSAEALRLLGAGFALTRR